MSVPDRHGIDARPREKQPPKFDRDKNPWNVKAVRAYTRPISAADINGTVGTSTQLEFSLKTRDEVDYGGKLFVNIPADVR